MDIVSNAQKEETKLFLPTYLRIDKLYYVDVPSGSSCPAVSDVPDVRRKTSKVRERTFFGICIFNTVDQYFTIDPEAIPIVRASCS